MVMRTGCATAGNGSGSSIGCTGSATFICATCSRYQSSAEAIATPDEPRSTTFVPCEATSNTSRPALSGIAATTKLPLRPGTTREISAFAAPKSTCPGVGVATGLGVAHPMDNVARTPMAATPRDRSRSGLTRSWEIIPTKLPDGHGTATPRVACVRHDVAATLHTRTRRQICGPARRAFRNGHGSARNIR